MGNTFRKSIIAIDNVTLEIEKTKNNYTIDIKNINLSEYDIIINNNNIVLNKKNVINIKHINELNNFNINKSKIKKCKINNVHCTKLKYKNIFINILDIINNKDKISHTLSKIKIVNCDEKYKNNKQYYHYERFNIYIKNTLSDIYIREIYNLCIIYDIKLSIHIITENNEYITIHINNV